MIPCFLCLGASCRGKGEAEEAGKKAKRRKKQSISAFARWSSVVACGLALMLFCAFGFFPCPLCFYPLAPAPCLLALAVAFPSHSPRNPLALSPRIPLAFGFHMQRHPWGVGVSGCRVGSGCRGVGTARVSGCRLGVSALPLPLPLQLAPRQRKQGIKNPAFFSFTIQVTTKDCKSSALKLSSQWRLETIETSILCLSSLSAS